MKKTYKNAQTGLTLTVDGPVIHVSEPRRGKVAEQKMNFGDEKTAARLAESIARDLRAVEVKEEAA